MEPPRDASCWTPGDRWLVHEPRIFCSIFVRYVAIRWTASVEKLFSLSTAVVWMQRMLRVTGSLNGCLVNVASHPVTDRTTSAASARAHRVWKTSYTFQYKMPFLHTKERKKERKGAVWVTWDERWNSQSRDRDWPLMRNTFLMIAFSKDTPVYTWNALGHSYLRPFGTVSNAPLLVGDTKPETICHWKPFLALHVITDCYGLLICSRLIHSCIWRRDPLSNLDESCRVAWRQWRS